MATTDSKQIMDAEEGKEAYDTGIMGKEVHHAGLGERVRRSISAQSMDENSKEGQIFSMNDVDPALDAKMRLVNNVSATFSYSYNLRLQGSILGDGRLKLQAGH